MFERYKEHLIFRVYRKEGDVFKVVGRIVYDSNKLAPIRREHWPAVKLNPLSLGEEFTETEEFLRRLEAVRDWQKGGPHGQD